MASGPESARQPSVSAGRLLAAPPVRPLRQIKAPVQAWHPITKLVAVLGGLALAWLWWTGDDSWTGMASDDPAGTVPVVQAEPAPVPQVRPQAEGALFARALPSIEAFSGMLERPLFSSTRRPAAVVPDAHLAVMDVSGASVEPAAGPRLPGIRFIGSVEEDGTVRAFVGDGLDVQALATGDEIEGWRVVSIEPRRLVLGLDDERYELKILE
ncbi:MAG: hypothetical protein R3D25_14385 [Geminicoccaceae bacterium]